MLFLLCLLLALLLLVLFVPARYKIEAEKQEETKVLFQVAWLFRILSFRGSYVGNDMKYRFKVFGITIRSSEQDKNKKQRVKKKRRERQDREKNKNPASVKWEDAETELKTQKEEIEKKEIEKKDVMLEKTATYGTEEKKKEQLIAIEEKKYSDKNEKNEKDTKRSFWKRIKNYVIEKYNAVTYIFIKINKIRKSILCGFQNIVKGIKGIVVFWEEEANKEAFQKIRRSVWLLCKHILPTKLRGYLKLGTGDPCSTGQALGAIAVFYSVVGEKLTIIPDFEEKVLEFKIAARGRIRLFTAGKICITLFLDDNFKVLRQNFKNLKEEL